MPAIADGAVWDETRKYRAAIFWDGVVERIYNGLGGYQE